MTPALTDYQSLIERLGVHDAIGPEGEGFGIEQSPSELAAFLNAIPPVESVLEIGTGYRAGLARFMGEHLGWAVTSIDNQQYGHVFPNAKFIVSPTRVTFDHDFNLVIIDADHSYEAVKADVEHYAAYSDRVMMLHDICGLRGCEGAAQYWRELAYTKAGKLRKGFREIIAEGERRVGIGWWLK